MSAKTHVDVRTRNHPAIKKDAEDAFRLLSESTKGLVRYYEACIRATTLEQVNGALYVRRSKDSRNLQFPQISLTPSREIPSIMYTGEKTVKESEIQHIQRFMTGLCRDHYNEAGIEVVVEKEVKPTTEWFLWTGEYITIDIYNTSVILKLVLAIESEHRHPVRADNEAMTITSYPTQSMLSKILNMIEATTKTGAGTSTVVGILDSPTKEEKKELSDNKT